MLAGLFSCVQGLSAVFNVATTPEFRTALQQAARNAKDDTINIAAGTYRTTDDGIGTFVFLDDEPHSLTIRGADSETTTLDGAGQNRVLNVVTQDTNAVLVIEDLTFTGGTTTGENGDGAGLLSPSFTTIRRCSFTGNDSVGNKGGGMCLENGGEIWASSIVQNTAGAGGGLWCTGDLSLVDLVISNNSAGGTEGWGGGIYCRGQLSVERCEISANTASGGAGGIVVEWDADFFESTVSDNTSGMAGPGGIWGGDFRIHFCQFMRNVGAIGAVQGGNVTVSESWFSCNEGQASNGAGAIVGECLVHRFTKT